MTKVDLDKIVNRIEEAGKAGSIPPENIKQAVAWAKKNLIDLEIEEVAERMGSVVSQTYGKDVEKVVDSDPYLRDFLKEHPPLKKGTLVDVAYGALAAVAYHRTDWRTYGEHVRTFEREGSLFGLPGRSAAYLDEVDRVLRGSDG